MDMEQRKVRWQNTINALFSVAMIHIGPVMVRRIVSICQDAYNEGREAGLNEASQESLLNTEKTQ